MKFGEYQDERGIDMYERFGYAVLFGILWSILGTGSTGIIGESILCIVLALAAEFSFQFEGSELKIRSAGKRWSLDGVLKLIAWPTARLLKCCGISNVPILVYYITAFGVYAILFTPVNRLDFALHLALMWFLYYMRKKDK